MGQQEVFDFMKKNNGKWFTSREIAEKLKIGIGSVQNSLRKLRRDKSIYYRRINKKSIELFEYRYNK